MALKSIRDHLWICDHREVLLGIFVVTGGAFCDAHVVIELVDIEQVSLPIISTAGIGSYRVIP